MKGGGNMINENRIVKKLELYFRPTETGEFRTWVFLNFSRYEAIKKMKENFPQSWGFTWKIKKY